MFPLGVALCVVRLVDVVPMSKAHLAAAVLDDLPEPRGYAWLLDRIREVERVRVRGNRGDVLHSCSPAPSSFARQRK